MERLVVMAKLMNHGLQIIIGIIRRVENKRLLVFKQSSGVSHIHLVWIIVDIIQMMIYHILIYLRQGRINIPHMAAYHIYDIVLREMIHIDQIIQVPRIDILFHLRQHRHDIFLDRRIHGTDFLYGIIPVVQIGIGILGIIVIAVNLRTGIPVPDQIQKDRAYSLVLCPVQCSADGQHLPPGQIVYGLVVGFLRPLLSLHGNSVLCHAGLVILLLQGILFIQQGLQFLSHILVVQIVLHHLLIADMSTQRFPVIRTQHIPHRLQKPIHHFPVDLLQLSVNTGIFLIVHISVIADLIERLLGVQLIQLPAHQIIIRDDLFLVSRFQG